MPDTLYVPKYKVGQTVLSLENPELDDGLIVMETYRGFAKYSKDFSDFHPNFDESNADNVLYGLLDINSSSYITPFWVKESQMIIFCSNCQRGRNQLLNHKAALDCISRWYSIYADDLKKYIEMLKSVEP